MTDYAKLESELRSTRNREFIPSLRKQAADALAQAVRERDELAASAERAAELARQRGADLIKAEAELASAREKTLEAAALQADAYDETNGQSGTACTIAKNIRALKTNEPT